MTSRNKFTKKLHDLVSHPEFFALLFGVILVVTLLFTISQIRGYGRQGFLAPRRLSMKNIHRPPPVKGEFGVSGIQPWMTFEYINTVFSLPPDYLQRSLSIQDSHYPKISLVHFSRESKESLTQTLSRVQQAIANRSSSSGVSP